MKRVHHSSPTPPQGAAKTPRGENKRKNSSLETNSSKKRQAHSPSVIEKLLHGSQKVISELQAIRELSDPEVAIQKIEKAAQGFAELQRMANEAKVVRT